MSLSEGNAKTFLEQIPVTYSRKAYWPHKSTFTTQRKSVQSVQIRGKKRTHPLAYCPPGRVSSVDLSWHTSSVGVPGYSWYCPPGSRVTCAASCPVRIVLEDCHMQGNTVYFLFIALGRIVTFCKEGDGMLSVWALRARSYKTKAEA